MTPQDFFSLLADQTRLRCLLLLQKENELCVCELSHILESIQPKVSRHLAHLRKSGLVLDMRKGQWVYYRLNEELQKWMKDVLAATLENLKAVEPYRSDLRKLTHIQSKNICCIDD